MHFLDMLSADSLVTFHLSRDTTFAQLLASVQKFVLFMLTKTMSSSAVELEKGKPLSLTKRETTLKDQNGGRNAILAIWSLKNVEIKICLKIHYISKRSICRRMSHLTVAQLLKGSPADQSAQPHSNQKIPGE